MIAIRLLVFLTGLTPVSELRGAIPLGVLKGLSFVEAFAWAYLGNLIGVLLAMLFLKFVYAWLVKNFSFFDKLFEKIFARTHKKFYKKFEKWGKLALLAFVAVPLPVTGGYTGAIAAFLFKIPIKQALPLIALGIFIAGIIVSVLVYAGTNVI